MLSKSILRCWLSHSSQNIFRHQRNLKAGFPMKNHILKRKSIFNREAKAQEDKCVSAIEQYPALAGTSTSGHSAKVSGTRSRCERWAHRSPLPKATCPPWPPHSPPPVCSLPRLLLEVEQMNGPIFGLPGLLFPPQTSPVWANCQLGPQPSSCRGPAGAQPGDSHTKQGFRRFLVRI